MEVAFIAPISLLNTQREQSYQLMLPQLFPRPKYQKAYHEFVMQDNFVILDNGAAEDNQVTQQELLQIAFEMRVDEVAIPDTLYDANVTLLQLDSFFSMNLDMIDQLQKRYGTQFGFVAQGNDIIEAFVLVDTVLRCRWEQYISTVYLPRLLVERRGVRHARIKLAEQIYNAFGDRLNIHLFGSAPSYTREARIAAVDAPYIRSIDTSLPYNLAYNMAALVERSSTSKYESGKRPDNYFEQPAEKFDSAILQENLSVYRSWANG